MSEDPRTPDSSDADGDDTTASEIVPDSAAALDRLLPPPAFPPGASRKAPSQRHFQASSINMLIADLGIPEEAVISPDAPLRPRSEREIPFDFEIDDEDHEDGLEVEITGIGEAGSPYYDRGRTSFRGRLGVEEVARALDETARILREDGPAVFLRIEGGSRFEATLRGFIAGYLIGEDE